MPIVKGDEKDGRIQGTVGENVHRGTQAANMNVPDKIIYTGFQFCYDLLHIKQHCDTADSTIKRLGKVIPERQPDLSLASSSSHIYKSYTLYIYVFVACVVKLMVKCCG